MLKNYFKTAIRNLIKNKLYTIINIVGLGAAVACSIVAYVNYQFSQSFDVVHENKENIYRVNSYKIVSGGRENWAITPMALTPALKKDIPGVEAFTRFQRGNGTIRFGDKVFNESFHFVDEDYFNMFTYPLIFGSKDMLYNENGIIIVFLLYKSYSNTTYSIEKIVLKKACYIINPRRDSRHSKKYIFCLSWGKRGDSICKLF